MIVNTSGIVDVKRNSGCAQIDIHVHGQRIEAEEVGGGTGVDLKADVGLRIAFDGGLPVIETLEMLYLRVSDVLDMFKPDFPV